MNQSEDIKELVTALSKAQGQMEPAVFNKVSHFKRGYADFTSCMNACRVPLSSNGLSIMQYCDTINDKLILVTLLAHISGQWVKSYFPLNPAKLDSQSVGSSMTYAKRYSLSALLGIVSDEEDDDGEASVGRGRSLQKGIEHVENNETVEKEKYISYGQVDILSNIEDTLDESMKKRVWDTFTKSYGITEFKEVTQDLFNTIVTRLTNAAKIVEQEKKDKQKAEETHEEN